MPTQVCRNMAHQELHQIGTAGGALNSTHVTIVALVANATSATFIVVIPRRPTTSGSLRHRLQCDLMEWELRNYSYIVRIGPANERRGGIILSACDCRGSTMFFSPFGTVCWCANPVWKPARKQHPCRSTAPSGKSSRKRKKHKIAKYYFLSFFFIFLAFYYLHK